MPRLLQHILTVCRKSEGLASTTEEGVQGPSSVLRRSPFFLLAVLLLLGACDDSFTPLTEEPTEFFAVYGFLDSDADTQFVRVSPVRPLLDPNSRPDDIRVFSTQVNTNNRIAWHDSLITLDDGTTGLLFYTPFRAEQGATYLLEIQDAENNSTEAITEVPPRLSLRVDSLSKPFDFIQSITWLNLYRQPARSIIEYTVAPPSGGPPTAVMLPITNPGRSVGDGWSFSINLSRDRNTILRQLDRSITDSTLVLLNVQMEIEQRSSEWLTPDTPPNIQRGFGFFGAVSTSTDSWTLTAEDLRDIGFGAPPGPIP